MADVDFRVQHVSHARTVNSNHPPTGDSLRWSYKANDVGDIAYDLSLADDQALAIQYAISPGDPPAFAPYAQDWRLQGKGLTGGWENLHGGIITSVNLRPRTGVVAVAGKDFAHWLEQPVWFPFYETQFSLGDLKDIVADWTKGIKKSTDFDAKGYYDNFAIKVWSGPDGATQRSVITDLLRTAGRMDYTINITPSFQGPKPEWDTILSYAVQVQDETNVLDHIKTVASMSDPYGYDFYTTWDRVMHFFGPRKTIGTSPTPTWVLTSKNVVLETVPDFDWTNNGPIGTYTIGLGQGSPALWHIKKDEETIARYRRWLRLVRVGDTYTGAFGYQQRLDGVEFGTKGLQFGYPHKDLKLSVYPNKLTEDDPLDGFRNHIGDVVRFRWDVYPYHTINAYFWITGQEYHGDAANNWICELSLEQIYAK